MTKTTEDVRLLLTTERNQFSGDDRLSIIARPIQMTPDGLRNVREAGFEPHPLADFQIGAAAAPNVDTFGDTYGWHREYRNVYSIDVVRADVMSKTLRRIDRGMKKLEQQFGFATDFPTYLVRVAHVLGITQFGWKIADGGSSWTYDGNEYRWVDASYVVAFLERQLADFRAVPAS